MTMPEGYESARITITEHVTDDDVVVRVEAAEDLPLVQILGLLRLSEDTIIRERMGEVPEEEEE